MEYYFVLKLDLIMIKTQLKRKWSDIYIMKI